MTRKYKQRRKWRPKSRQCSLEASNLPLRLEWYRPIGNGTLYIALNKMGRTIHRPSVWGVNFRKILGTIYALHFSTKMSTLLIVTLSFSSGKPGCTKSELSLEPNRVELIRSHYLLRFERCEMLKQVRVVEFGGVVLRKLAVSHSNALCNAWVSGGTNIPLRAEGGSSDGEVIAPKAPDI